MDVFGRKLIFDDDQIVAAPVSEVVHTIFVFLKTIMIFTVSGYPWLQRIDLGKRIMWAIIVLAARLSQVEVAQDLT